MAPERILSPKEPPSPLRVGPFAYVVIPDLTVTSVETMFGRILFYL